jgi:hypothetical protein
LQSEAAVKPKHLYAGFAVWCVLFFALVPSIRAQQTIPLRHVGAVHDWSEHQIIFSRDALARYPDLMDREPRLRQQVIERWQSPQWRALLGTTNHPNHPKKSRLERDWNVSGLGQRLRENAFPAKFSYNPEAPPDCINDYVVFGLSIVGVDGGQANLVAFNNLYVNDTGTGYCTGITGATAPTVMFAYNVSTNGGKIDTSPVPSLDGTQIAFVETVAGRGGTAVFHVLTWTAGQGAIGAAATPSQMSTLLFSTDPGTASSPWIDFSGDTAYVGDAVGIVYQITPVFNGTPVLSGNPGWPVTVSNQYGLTPPVLDSNQGLLMVGSLNGNLYEIDTSNGDFISTTIGAAGGTTIGIIAPPIVDVTNGTTFVVDANDGTTAVLDEVETSSGLILETGQIGLGSSMGTKVHLYQPAFSSAYFTNPTNGIVNVCGTGPDDTTPYQYTFTFVGTLMNTLTPTSQQLSLSTTDHCTGWTEFYNPYTGANVGPDTITATSISSTVLTVTASNTNLSIGDEVYIQGTAESFLNGSTVTVTSLITGGSPPHPGFTANFNAPDYSNPSDTGSVYAGVDFFFFGLTSDCTFIGGAGASTGGCVVALAYNAGATTPTTSEEVAAGPSGIVVDNYSTAAEASSIYLTSLSEDIAYKFTQEGLN